ncbi:MAG: DUF2752 domain-containing protein [Acidimicrobiia bacterium]|nr:DUF2752 domain-containing protein [Acidimicrobiia bacterium]
MELTANRWFRLLAIAVAVAAVGWSAASDDGPVLCPFRRCTGGYCPGCGITRSTAALIRGDVAGSWHHHPFLLIAAAQAAVLTALWSVATAELRAALLRRRDALLAANGVIVAAVWAVRLATGQIPLPFS